MKYIADYPVAELKGKRVLVRAGLDIPLTAAGEVSDVFRVQQAAETIVYLQRSGARVIVLSHIGRDPHATNVTVARALKQYVPDMVYISDLLGPLTTSALSGMHDGDVLLLENLRSNPGEKANDDLFAQALAHMADIYVDDAFSVAHRSDASIVGVPKYLPSYAGFLMMKEVTTLARALSPDGPSLAILGGSKFETKEPLLQKLLHMYDHVFVAGALANDVLKAQGFSVGRSLVSEIQPDTMLLQNPHFLSPVDVTVETPHGQAFVKHPAEVTEDDRLVDIGPETVAMLAGYISSAQSVLWNGPTGVYEKGYTHYTSHIAQIISHSRARAVIGGGDTVAAIQSAGVELSGNIFLSTGGGAMLDFLLYGTLPGIEVLQ